MKGTLLKALKGKQWGSVSRTTSLADESQDTSVRLSRTDVLVAWPEHIQTSIHPVQTERATIYIFMEIKWKNNK